MTERGTKAMTMSMAATHAAEKELHDAIFGASEACRLAALKHGTYKVTNATIGTMMDDEGKFATLPTVERIYRELNIGDYMRYAPIAGLPEYLETSPSLTSVPKVTLLLWLLPAAPAPSAILWPTMPSTVTMC